MESPSIFFFFNNKDTSKQWNIVLLYCTFLLSKLPCGIVVWKGLLGLFRFHKVRLPSEWLHINCFPSWCQATEWIAYGNEWRTWEWKGIHCLRCIRKSRNSYQFLSLFTTTYQGFRERTLKPVMHHIKTKWQRGDVLFIKEWYNIILENLSASEKGNITLLCTQCK